MTNREWLNTLTDEEFVTWLLEPDQTDYDKKIKCDDGTEVCGLKHPTPRLYTLKYGSTQSYTAVLEFLKKERKEQ